MNEDRKSGNIFTFLTAVTADGSSKYLDISGNSNITFQIIAASVTTGADMDIEVSLDGTNWGSISTTSISGNGSTIVSVSQEAHKYIRATLSSRTDGTYTVLAVVNRGE